MLFVVVRGVVFASKKSLPNYLGHSLHGFFEAALINYRPELLSQLRPNGENELAFYAMRVPWSHSLPESSLYDDALDLSFGILLCGSAQYTWPSMIAALHAQSAHGLDGYSFKIVSIAVGFAGLPAQEVFDAQDGLFKTTLNHPAELAIGYWRERYAYFSDLVRRQRESSVTLRFNEPLLLASNAAQIKAQASNTSLLSPSLNQVLKSIHARGTALAGLPDSLIDVALTPTKVVQSTSNFESLTIPYASARSRERGNHKPNFNLLALNGSVTYTGAFVASELLLLELGQWLGVGQKTTIGFGAYQLS
jgi:CRISPR-associated endoribonuclease Cas6